MSESASKINHLALFYPYIYTLLNHAINKINVYNYMQVSCQ